MKLRLLILTILTVSVSSAQSTLSRSVKELSIQDQMVNVLVKGNVKAIRTFTETAGGTFKYSAGDISSIRIKGTEIGKLAALKGTVRIETGSSTRVPLNDTMRIHNRIQDVHNGVAPLSQPYTGAGVVLGFIDTGIDFSHPDFKDATGNSRIRFLWDQNLAVSSNTPSPYGYGQEFTGADIDAGLAGAHYDTLYWGHGTGVAGLAAGDGSASGLYAGAAPDADIVFVAMNLNTSDPVVADAADYNFSKALSLGKPCVINASIGDYYGSHDGKNLEAQMISALLAQQSGRVMVAAAGNRGNVPFHYRYDSGTDTLFTWINMNPGTTGYIQVFGDSSQMEGVQFAIGLDKVSGGYSFRGRTPFMTIVPRLDSVISDTIFNGSNRIGIVQTYAEIFNGVYSFEFNIIGDSSGHWRLMSTGPGYYDAWSFGIPYSGLPDSTTYSEMKNHRGPDLDKTIVSSFQCLQEMITVGNYVNTNNYLDYNSNPVSDNSVTTGGLFQTSSHGPTRDNRVKPDIAATGTYIFGPSVLSMVPFISSTYPDMLVPGGFHIVNGGTSFASPIVAGTAALYLERFPNSTQWDVKNAIINCARTDSHTGSFLPDNLWGYGKLDAFSTVRVCNTSTDEILQEDISLFPNPAVSEVTVKVSNGFHPDEVVIFDKTGREVNKFKWPAASNMLTLPLNRLAPGVYYCRTISSTGGLNISRLVIQ